MSPAGAVPGRGSCVIALLAGGGSNCKCKDPGEGCESVSILRLTKGGFPCSVMPLAPASARRVAVSGPGDDDSFWVFETLLLSSGSKLKKTKVRGEHHQRRGEDDIIIRGDSRRRARREGEREREREREREDSLNF